MTTPLVTIIVPAYNHSRFITECINSIVNQTYKNLQIIVIDDASTDSTPDLIKHLSSIYNFQYILNEKNLGHIKVINSALNIHAKGKYVCLLASDDYFSQDKIEQQVNIMELNENITVCTGNAICIDMNSNPILPISNSLFFKEREIVFEELFMENTIPALTAMIRRDIYKKIGFYNENIITEDWYCWLRILNNGGKIYHYNKIWGFYRVLQTSLSKSNEDRLYNAEVKVIEEYKSHLLFKKKSDSLYENMCLQKSLNAIKVNKKKEALNFLLMRKVYDKTFLSLLKKIIIL